MGAPIDHRLHDGCGTADLHPMRVGDICHTCFLQQRIRSRKAHVAVENLLGAALFTGSISAMPGQLLLPRVTSPGMQPASVDLYTRVGR